MILATFRAGTPHEGRSIEYESGVFSLQAFGPVAVDFVLQADAAGHLQWAYDGLREWTQHFPSSVQSIATLTPSAVIPAEAPSPAPLPASGFPSPIQPSPQTRPDRASQGAKSRSRKRRAWGALAAALAIIAVAGAVVWHVTRPPALINFQPAGGKYPTLQKAIDAVKLGGTVRLATGIYNLPAPITIRRTVHLEGAGSGSTTLRCASGAAVTIVDCPASESCSLEGIHFTYAGTAPGNAVDIDGGMIRLNDCQFSGAVGDGSPGGYGISLETPGVRASLTACTSNDNSSAGFVVLPSDDIALNQCTATANGQAGLMLTELNASSIPGAASATELAITTSSSTNVTVRNSQFNQNKGYGVRIDAGDPSISANQCMENTRDGIAVDGQSAPKLQTNECSENARSGIVFAASSAGVATANTCSYNTNNGISVQGKSQAHLSSNTCSHNRGGILCGGHSLSAVTGNRCSANKVDGIQVRDSASADVIANHCTGNVKQAGISFFDHARGVARGNVCESDLLGIELVNHAKASLVKNTASLNTLIGIAIYDHGSGVVTGNRCLGNRVGIMVYASASPHLGSNAVSTNSLMGVLDGRHPTFGTYVAALQFFDYLKSHSWLVHE